MSIYTASDESFHSGEGLVKWVLLKVHAVDLASFPGLPPSSF